MDKIDEASQIKELFEELPWLEKQLEIEQEIIEQLVIAGFE